MIEATLQQELRMNEENPENNRLVILAASHRSDVKEQVISLDYFVRIMIYIFGFFTLISLHGILASS